MTLRSYRCILQQRLRFDDTKWQYSVPNLPKAVDCDRAGLMKSCSLVANSTRQDLSLSFIALPENRAISNRPLNQFIHVTCADFRLQTEDGQPSTFRESAEYISRFLKFGIILNGIRYSFYGHSNSQLKSRSCFLMAGTGEEVDRMVAGLGDFSKMKTVAKKVKRIGLLFSTAHAIVDVPPERCRDVADIERDGYNFTDGCGSISPKLARLLSQKRPILFRNRRYHPSVFQIRYRGYKGVVTVKPKMEAGVQLELRNSMRKFSGGDDHSFAVVGYSQPFTYGYLNDETVLLLHSLGIDRDVIARKQHEYLNFLLLAKTDATAAFRFISSVGDVRLAEAVLVDGFESVKGQVQKRVKEELAKLLNKRSEHKCRILVPRSRLLFGICDPYGVLRENECFVQPTLDEDGVPHPLCGASVLVARNPCLHPGDLRKLEAVVRSELRHLTDCIVFPTQGRRPAADMMSGGDLDGDLFFVAWDDDIIPNHISQAAEYPGAREAVQFSQIMSHDRIDYFAHTSSMQLGQIKNLYLRWARHKGPLSSECQELNRLFSQCVDANRIKIPERLKSLPNSPPENEPFILDFLHDLAMAFLRAMPQSDVVDHSTSKECLQSILTESNTMSQFELAQLTHRWCQSNDARFDEFLQYFDFTSMSVDERAWIGTLLPPGSLSLETLHNDLMHSSILTHSELSAVRLRHVPIRWKRVFRSDEDRIANLLEAINTTFPLFIRKFLVLQIHDRLSVALYLPKTVVPSDEFPLSDAGRLFAFPHQKGDTTNSRFIVPTKHNACFVFDHSGFQLFEGTRANTFVFFTRSPNDDSQYRNVEGRGRKVRSREQTIQEGINYDWRVSIALNKFSQRLATHIGRLYREGVSSAELYVVSNSDTRSIRNLDLWLEQVDTDKVHHNFKYERDPEPPPCDHDWTTESEVVVSIAKRHDFSSLSTSATPDDFARVLDIAWSTQDFQLAARLFSYWINRLTQLSSIEPRDQSITLCAIEFLVRMPQLTIYFVQLCPWNRHQQRLRNLFLTSAMLMVRALILCANNMGALIFDKLKLLLGEVPTLTLENLSMIVELVALTVKIPETAQEVLLGVLEPMATHLLLETPRMSEYAVKMLAAIAIDHIEEAQDFAKSAKTTEYHWQFDRPIEWNRDIMSMKCTYRIDAPQAVRLKVGDHVRFTCVEPPPNLILTKSVTFEAVVEKSDVGEIVLRCLRHPPSFYQRCNWRLDHCGSFTTSQTMIDSIVKLIGQKQACCGSFPYFFRSLDERLALTSSVPSTNKLSRLNPSQRRAVSEAVTGPLTCIWGPPGTGKTHTIVSIVSELVRSDQNLRLLVTAPTHNAVDNVMRQYLKQAISKNEMQPTTLRVSTDVHKVAPDLRGHTCDAMLGKDINQFPSARRKAQQRISQARLIFSTCIGSGLGLLRNEQFDNVIVDEASQQSEPASMVPLVKGSKRVILVGDHVQLRPTVQPLAQILGFDVSLFERLWTDCDLPGRRSTIRRVMLDTQYRMHPDICTFPSREFYDSKLQTADCCKNIQIPDSEFKWPPHSARVVFIQTSSPEDHSRKSKSNTGQAKLCEEVVCKLRSVPSSPKLDRAKSSIAILTPYTRQAEHLQTLLPDETVSSIDGYQGQEADVIIYVTVRCNPHREIGFLKDMRRLNVALTRAKAGLIIIGDEATLTGRSKPLEDGKQLEQSHRVWKTLIDGMSKVQMDKA